MPAVSGAGSEAMPVEQAEPRGIIIPHRQPAAVGAESDAIWLLPPSCLNLGNQLEAGAIQPDLPVPAGGGKPAVWREAGTIAAVAVVDIACALSPPLPIVGIDPQTIGPAQSCYQETPVRRECEMDNLAGQALDPVHHPSSGTVDQIKLLLWIGLATAHPAANGDQGSIRADRHGIDLADIARPDRQAEGAQQPAVGHRPDPHRLVVRAGH